MNKFSSEISSDFLAVDNLVEKLEGFLKENSVLNKKIKEFHIILIVRELLINAIEHGNKMDEIKKVFFSLEFSTNNAIIVVRDEGEGFDISQLHHLEKNSQMLAENLGERGRGFSLLQQWGCTVEKIGVNAIKVDLEL